ncbi:MAG: hypothetical protein WBU20_20745, partial [Candidatus Acidiferrum sp.]
SYTIPPPKKTGVNSAGTPQYGPSGAGIWSAPTIDSKRGLLYITTSDNYSRPASKTSDAVLALDLKSGQIVWTRQTTAGDVSSGGACPDDNSPCGPDFDFGSSALLLSVQGHDVLVAGQKSGVVYALDPDANGKILWQARRQRRQHRRRTVGHGGRRRQCLRRRFRRRPSTRNSRRRAASRGWPESRSCPGRRPHRFAPF